MLSFSILKRFAHINNSYVLFISNTILTFRWKRDQNSEIQFDKATLKPILQFVAIQRKDNKEWAIPGVWIILLRQQLHQIYSSLDFKVHLSVIANSHDVETFFETALIILWQTILKGMVDPGELVSATLKREFAEEALNSLEADEEEKDAIRNAVDEVFQNGVEVSIEYFIYLYLAHYTFTPNFLKFSSLKTKFSVKDDNNHG